MAIYGIVVVFNTTPYEVNLVLNGASLAEMQPVRPEYDYMPFPPLIVDRIFANQVYGQALFSHTNVLKVQMSSFQIIYQLEIDTDAFPIEDDLQLFIFSDEIYLSSNGHLVQDAVSRLSWSNTAYK